MPLFLLAALTASSSASLLMSLEIGNDIVKLRRPVPFTLSSDSLRPHRQSPLNLFVEQFLQNDCGGLISVEKEEDAMRIQFQQGRHIILARNPIACKIGHIAGSSYDQADEHLIDTAHWLAGYLSDQGADYRALFPRGYITCKHIEFEIVRYTDAIRLMKLVTQKQKLSKGIPSIETMTIRLRQAGLARVVTPEVLSSPSEELNWTSRVLKRRADPSLIDELNGMIKKARDLVPLSLLVSFQDNQTQSIHRNMNGHISMRPEHFDGTMRSTSYHLMV